MAKWTDRAREDLARSQGKQTASAAVTEPTSQRVSQVTPKTTTQDAEAEQSTPSGGWTARMREDIQKRTTGQRDDAAVRRGYAQRHPEETGGEQGARTREVNSAVVLAKSQVDKLQKKYDAAGQKHRAAAPTLPEEATLQDARSMSPTAWQGYLKGVQDRAKTGEEREAARLDLYDAKELLGSAQRQKAQLEREKELLEAVSTPEWERRIRDQYATPDQYGRVSEDEVRSQKIKAAKGMATAERDRAKAEMAQLTNGGRTPVSMLRGEALAKYQETEARYDDWAQRVIELSNMDATARNQSALGRMTADGQAAGHYGAAAKAKEDQQKLNEVIGYYKKGGGSREEYEPIAKLEAELREDYGLELDAINAFVNGDDTPRAGMVSVRQVMDAMEALATANTGALEDRDAGYDFKDIYSYEKRAKRQEEAAQAREKQAAFAREHPVLSSAATVPMSMLQWMDLLNMDWGSGKPGEPGYIPPDASGMALASAIQTVRGTVSKELERNTDWEIAGQNVASFMYQTGMSMADSTASIATLGPGSIYLMGANAAVNGAKNITDRGGTSEQALWGGLAAGAAEMLFEKVSVEALLEPKSITGWRSWLRETMKQGGIEASEEVFTEIANILSDTAIMGANSEFARAVEDYQRSGLTPEEAKRKAYLDLVGQVTLAGVGGAISGMGMEGAKGGYEALSQRSTLANASAGAQNGPWGGAKAPGAGEVDVDTPATGWAQNGLKTAIAGDGAQESVSPLLKPALEARVTVREGQQKTAPEGEAAGTGLVPISTEDRNWLASGKRNIVADTVKDIVSFARNALSKKGGQERLYLGVVPDSAAKMVRAETGLDVTGYKAILTGDAVQHTFKHHGDPIQEQARGQRAVTPDDFGMLPKILAEPDSVKLVDGTDSQGRRVLWFSKQFGDMYVTAQAVTDGRHALTTDSVWVQKKKSQQNTTPDAGVNTDPVPNVQDAPLRDSSTDSIPQTAQDVNARMEARVQELERGIAQLDRQRVERGVQRMGAAGRAGLRAAIENRQKLGGFDEDLTEAGLVDGYMDFYLAGMNGTTLDADGMPKAAGPNAKRLLSTEQRYAYENGKRDAAARVAENKRRAGYATVAGQEKGLVWDDYVAQGLSRAEADRMNEVAKRLNVRVRFVDSVLEGRANGQIVEADICITKDTEQPIMAVFGHEVGHWLERTAPDAYQAMRQFATQHHQAEIEGLMELYDREGIEKGYDEISKEFVNDDIGRMIAEPETLARFIEENKNNRSLLQRVADALRALWQKLTGKDRRQVKTAEEALLAALKASEAQAAKLEAEGRVMGVAQGAGGGEYQLKGRRGDGIEVYETSEEVRALPWRERRRRFLDIMQEEYRGRTAKFVTRDGETYYAKFDDADIKKNIYGDKRSDSAGRDAKINVGADGSIFDLVENTTHKSSDTEAGKRGSAHQDVTGWEYFVKTVQIDGHVFDLLANVRKKPNGEYVYSIQLNENKKMSASPVAVFAQGDPASEWGTTDSDSVPQPAEEVNGDFSLKGSALLTQEVAQVMEQSQQEGWSTEQTQEEIRAAVQSTLQSLVEEYGAIKPGESPAREVQVPRRTAKNEKVSQTVRTILEARATPEAAVPTIEELTVKGDFSYQALSDKTAIERAAQTIQHKGWGRSLGEWFHAVKSGTVSKDNTVMGWALYNHAANTGDIETAMDIIQSMVRHQRNAAQAVQATRILKQMSPETQLYGVQRSVDSLQEELNERYGDKKAPKLVIDKELAERLLNAADQDERDGVLRDIYRDVGRQLPSTFVDKWNAWRYLSMLGNVRTHVRNIAGNAGFMPVVAVKDLTATAIERAVYAVSGGKLERSKGLVGPGKKGKGLLAAAWGDYAKVQDVALGGGKYGEFQNADRYIEEGRVVFKSKPGKVLEAARKANSTALDAEDMWFSKPHYAYAMAQYCAAQGITEETVRTGAAKALDKAREYAIKEAQKATYRDTNALSQLLGGLGRDLRRSKNVVSRAAGMLVEGVLPFRKTPANILARGLEYSPLGLVKGLSYDLAQVKRGNMTGAEAIDHISAGLTGTGLLALGVYMAAQGLLRGKGPGDDKERELEKLQGHQDYSLEIGDTSVTLDWLAPEALPLFVGVNLWETMQEDGDVTMSDVLSAVSNVSDPLLEMSCLQSLNDIFDSVGYAGQNETNPLTAALVSGVTSYLTQGLPTVFGQAERVFETQRETTYTSKDAFLTGDMQYFLGKVSGKAPGWEFQQIPWVDAWGRTEDTGSLGQRAVNNMLNPAYVSEIEESPMERELERLYDATGEGGVFPSRARTYFQVNGKRRDLSAEEYVGYATRKGQTARKVVEALVDKKGYRELEKGERAEAVKDAYQYAEQTARQGVAKEYDPDSWVVKAQEAEKRYKIPVETYILLRNQCAGLESIRDKDGEPIANSKGLQIMEAVYETPGLVDRQRGYLFEALGAGKSIQHYNKALVKEKLGKMRSKTK